MGREKTPPANKESDLEMVFTNSNSNINAVMSTFSIQMVNQKNQWEKVMCSGGWIYPPVV